MRKNGRLIAIVFIILVSIVRANLTQAKQSEILDSSIDIQLHSGGFPWHGEYVHKVNPPSDVGTYASLALEPFRQTPYIAYYDAQYGDLLLAHFTPGVGNCDAYGDDWHCDLLDGNSGDNVGTYSSLDFWADEATQGWKIGISYHDTTNKALKFISWSCSGITCTVHNKVTITSTNDALRNIGLFTSFKFLNNGNPLIVYQTTNSMMNLDSLRYATYVGSGGNCGEGSALGKWNCQIIDAGQGIGQYASLDITYDGVPYVAYYDQGLGNLKVAYYLGIVATDCYVDNGWYCAAVDSVGDVGMYASITAQHFYTDKLFRIAYYDATTDHLKYYDPDFGAVVVDDMGTYTGHMGISLDVDPDGYPIIAYMQSLPGDFETTDLRVARPYWAFHDNNFGNCGNMPPGYPILYWRCTNLDDRGQYFHEAGFTSVAVNSYGLAQIAYTEFYDFDIVDHATSLKFISQALPSYLPVISKQP